MAQDFGNNKKLNKTLASKTGYTGSFGGGEFGHWLAGQSDGVRGQVEQIKSNHPTYNAEGRNVTNMHNPQMPNGGKYKPVLQKPKASEMMKGQEIDVDALQAEAGQAQAPDPTQANTYDPTQIGDSTPEGQAAQGTLSEAAQMDAAQQKGVSEEYQSAMDEVQSQIDNFEMDERATVQHQYKELMNFEPGDTPNWAKGAITEAEQRMAARGMGSSSMAAGAVSAATMRAALPIAQQDAQVFQTMSMAKFDKRSQATLMKASHIAQLDMTNLNNRQQAAVVNAQNFMAMDMSNLNNRQQTAILNTQSRVQAMLSDQAAANASKQFNAKSENDIDMFYSSMQSQIEQFNAAQRQGINKFNTEVANQREQFNVKNGLLIEQANVEYLRGISMRNTQMKNQANYVNSQNLLDVSNTAMANQIQLLRDREAYVHEMSESAKDRATQRYLSKENIGAQMDIADQEMKMQVGAAVGNFAGGVLGSGIEAGWFS